MSIKPKLTLFDTTMAVVSLVIGIGIFRTPSIVAQNTGLPIFFFLAWIIGGLIAMFGALIYAEIGSRKPLAGGFYKIVSEIYHPALAFMLNWLYIFLNSASFAAIALIGSEYILSVIPYRLFGIEADTRLVALTITLILFAVNYCGIKMSAVSVNILTVIKITMIVIFAVIAFILPSNNMEVYPVIVVNNAKNLHFWVIGLGLISVFYTFGGYQMSMNLCSDIKNPKRNIPFGIIGGMVIVTALYLGINYGYYRILGLQGIASSPLIAADMAKILIGDTGGRIISVVIFISVVGWLNATLMQLPRAFYAMAEDKVLPKIFMKINDKTQAQGFTLAFITLCAIAFIILHGKFDSIINMVMFNDAIILAILASTIFVMRKKEKESKSLIRNESYKIPFYPLIPIIYIVFLMIVTVSAFIQDSTSAIVSTVIFLLGYPLFRILRKFNNQENIIEN